MINFTDLTKNQQSMLLQAYERYEKDPKSYDNSITALANGITLDFNIEEFMPLQDDYNDLIDKELIFHSPSGNRCTYCLSRIGIQVVERK